MSSYTLAMSNKCPRCERGKVFETWYTIAEKCEVCGARYLRDAGSWTGPTVLGYMLGGTLGVGSGWVLVMSGNYFPHAELWIGVMAVAVTFAAFPYLKAWWIGYLYETGQVYPDKPPG